MNIDIDIGRAMMCARRAMISAALDAAADADGLVDLLAPLPCDADADRLLAAAGAYGQGHIAGCDEQVASADCGLVPRAAPAGSSLAYAAGWADAVAA